MASAPVPLVLPAPRSRRLSRRFATAVITTLAATIAVVLPATPAHAAPTGPTAADVNAQIVALNNQIETIVEQYNGVTTKLDADRKAARKLVASLGLVETQASDAQKHIATIVHDVYIAGPMSSAAALLDVDSMNALIDKMTAMDAIAHAQNKTARNASALAAKYRDDKANLDRIVADETVKKAALATKKTTILAKIADLTTLQAKLAAEAAAAAAAAKARADAAAKAAAAKAKATTPSTHGTSHGYAYSYVHPVSCPHSTTTGPGHTAAVKACSLLWPVHMYGWAEAGPDKYDCSGLTMVAWKAAGKSLLHYTGDQWNETHAITKADLRPGDLIFYNSRNHVALYIGNGWIVQAEHTGEPLKESDMYFMTPVTNGFRRVNGT